MVGRSHHQCLALLTSIFSNQWVFLFLFFFLGGGIPAAYGGSQARGRIRAVAAGLPHSHLLCKVMQDLSGTFDLHHSSRPHRILNPLREDRDQTHILMDASRVG